MDEYIDFGYAAEAEAEIGLEMDRAYNEGYAQGKADAVKTGSWDKYQKYSNWHKCTVCGESEYLPYLNHSNYCPNCGAKMGGNNG